MSKPTTLRASRTTIVLNKVKTFFSKPHNVILLLLGIVLTFTTVAPIVAIVQDTFKIHAGTIDAHLTGQASGYTTVNYIDLFTSTWQRRICGRRFSTRCSSLSARAWCPFSTAGCLRF